ncbi:MAG: GTPase HflX [Myxococcales bacterium]|nr:MAG: GTPase HflX [Myxococcales bacterium]
MQVYGNTHGLSPTQLKSLERLYRRRVPFEQLTTPELTSLLCSVSHATRRQIGVLIDRSGEVEFVIVGDATKIMLPDIGRLRAAQGRFRALRLVHTHLRGEELTRDDLVDLTRLRLDLVAAIILSSSGSPSKIHYAHCIPVPEDSSEEPFRKFGPTPYGRLDCNPAQIITALEAEYTRASRIRHIQAKDGRAILVHVSDKTHASHVHESLQELKELARTAGVDVADTIVQIRDRKDPKYVLGKGKLEDVILRAMQLDVEVLIFDCNLNPNQASAISAVSDLKILDRSQLILDVFAQHAQSRDGKLQVELAQMRYLLPRLGTRDDALSRLTGGIGGRGPGETKLEIGRRRAYERISRLEKQLKQLGKQRIQRRSKRQKHGIPIVAIVGYTNAGKSTLLNALTHSDVRAENKLFATLDTRSRRLRFPEEKEIIITDTVGFIRNLPKDLWAAFRATFEEAIDADLILHVIDASDPSQDQHIETTEKLLSELGIDQTPRIMVYNKSDQLTDTEIGALQQRTETVVVSALILGSLLPLLELLKSRLILQQLSTLDPSNPVENH